MAIASAIRSISSAFMPLVVTAAVPSLTPLVTNGDCGSFGIVFLLAVIFASSNHASTYFPVNPLSTRSTNIKWLSVPPLTRLKPSAINASASAFALFTTCC